MICIWRYDDLCSLASGYPSSSISYHCHSFYLQQPRTTPPTCHWLSIPDPSGPIPHPCGGSLFILHCTTPEEWITNQLLCILSSRSQQQSRPPQPQLSPIKISWLCIHANIHVHATNTSLHSWTNNLVIISE